MYPQHLPAMPRGRHRLSLVHTKSQSDAVFLKVIDSLRLGSNKEKSCSCFSWKQQVSLWRTESLNSFVACGMVVNHGEVMDCCAS